MTELQAAVTRVIRHLRGGEGSHAFSKDAGLHPSHISKIEAGARMPTLPVLHKLASSCSITLTQLMELIEWEMKTARGSEPTGRLGKADEVVSVHLQTTPSSIGSQGGARNTQMAGNFAGARPDGRTHRAGLPTPMEIDRGTSTT